MADYRQIHVKMWKQDAWFLELAPMEKLLFVYLFSNELASIAGIYELPLRVISFETGLDTEFINSSLDKFASEGKAFYEGGVIWVVNLRKYNENPSPKVKTRIQKDLDSIPDCDLKTAYLRYHNQKIPYIYPTDTVPIPHPESASEHEHEQEHDNTTTADLPRIWKELWGSLVTAFMAQELESWSTECEHHRVNLPRGSPGADLTGAEWVKCALEEAAQSTNRPPNSKYIDRIIERWFLEGFRSDNRDGRREKKRTRRDEKPAGPGDEVFPGLTRERMEAAEQRLKRGGSGSRASPADDM